MVTIFLKSTLCMLFLWGIYKLVLENEKTHRFNRFYLLFSLFVSFAIPFFNFEIKTSFIQNEAIQEVVKIPNQTFLKEKLPDNQLVEVYSSQKWTGLRATEVSSKTFDLTRVLFFIWAFVSTVLLLRFAKNLFEIYQKIQRNERVFYQSSTIVLLKEAVLPCTFMQYIFVQKEDFDNQQFEPELLQHEQCHVQQLHTLDVILLEVFQVLFWFNPVVYLFKNAIKLNHEFLADDAVNQQNKDIPFYQRLLLTKAMAGNLQLTSSSTFQLTKQRLIMMTKHTSATVATLKIMLTVALTALIALGFSSRLSAQKQETKKNSLPVKQENKKATTAPTQKTKLPTEGEWIATARSSEALTLDDVDYKNGEYIITRDFVKPKKWEKIVKIKNKRYDELTEAERQKIGILIYTEKNGPPTEEQFRNWSSSDVYGVWVNDKRIENAQLKKYKREDIVQHDISRLYKNAQVGNRRWQIGMMTKEYYEKYIADFKANPFISIDMRTKK